ncbi:MAG: CobW family GTP-binding protein [Rikenellaceae bacterium]
MNERCKIPIVLISGFLGSGKTTLIGNFIEECSSALRVAVVQNEFAASGVDGQLLCASSPKFILRELNTGSIFCSCLFSHFKDAVVELSQHSQVDIIVVEATGIADPIGIAQLMEDESVASCCYLARIITIVDASRFLKGVSKIISAYHQVQVADIVMVSKTDLVNISTTQAVEREVKRINPLAKVHLGCSSEFMLHPLLFDSTLPIAVDQHIEGALTHCGSGGYVSKIFKTTRPIAHDKLELFLDSLDENILRLKGMVVDEWGRSLLIQYIPGQREVIPMNEGVVGATELISIGYSSPNFNLLNANTFYWNRES